MIKKMFLILILVITSIMLISCSTPEPPEPNGGDEFNVEEFSLMKMCEQLEYIFSLLALFTRKSDNLCTKIAKNNFRISKTFINNHQVYLVHDSITGLQSFKKAL